MAADSAAAGSTAGRPTAAEHARPSGSGADAGQLSRGPPGEQAARKRRRSSGNFADVKEEQDESNERAKKQKACVQTRFTTRTASLSKTSGPTQSRSRLS
eukprot:2675268-Pleurochrysis_carterae.AAC.2